MTSGLALRVALGLALFFSFIQYAWEGSQPPRNKEVLQTWDAIKALNQALVSPQEEESLQRCGKAVALFPFWAGRTVAGYEAIHMIRKGQAWQYVRRMEWPFLLHCFLFVCSLRRPKFPII